MSKPDKHDPKASAPNAGKYMPADQRCIAWAKGSYGAIDTPDEGLTAGLYENETSARHNNGAPMFAPDGTMLDETGKPSIFDATIRNDRP